MDLGSHSVPNTVFTFKVPVVLSNVWQECLGGRYGGLGKGRTVAAKQQVDGRDEGVSSALCNVSTGLMLCKDSSSKTGFASWGNIVWRQSWTCTLCLLPLWFFSETSSKKASVEVTPTGGASPSFTITICFLSVF